MKDLVNAVESAREQILAAERYLWEHPETGYKEEKTSAYLANAFEEMGYTLTYAEGIPGFVTCIDTGREGPEVMIMGEMDSVICPTHPHADSVTGAVHACGHHAQGAALLGIAAALKAPHILEKFSGRIRLCAVPAEEFLEIEYRNELRSQGKIKYLGGKSEFLSRGLFDGVDIALMVHTGGHFAVDKGSVGFLAKNVIYKGRSAHAGGAPWSGCNALYAANCGLNAVNAIRETFRESDLVRVHPIITHGGDIVNAIPEEVRLESYVRGSAFEGIAASNAKVNRALIGGALSLGANIEITDNPGYAPLVNAPAMVEIAAEAAALAMPEETFVRSDGMSTGSTDVGDLCCIMPVVQPYARGAKGCAHGNDYEIEDPVAACVTNAKWQLGMLLLLLGNGAERAKRILADFRPMFETKEEFLAYLDSLRTEGERIVYRADGVAEVKL